MKNLAIILVAFPILCPTAYGIGISPARWTTDVTEDGSTFRPGNNLTYTLRRGSTRYSSFNLSSPLGLDANITGISVAGGVDTLSSKSLIIDWDDPVLSSLSSITASVSVTAPSSWSPSLLVPGGHRIESLARHGDMASNSSGLGAVVSVVSQISLWRNYALDGEVVNLLDCYRIGDPVEFNVNVTDYTQFGTYMKYMDFSYEIDWESDGIIDESVGGIRMMSETGLSGDHDVAAGFKYKQLDFLHQYSAPGSYIATLNLRDRIETTSLRIPINVMEGCSAIPEPASMGLVILGTLGTILGRRRVRKNRR